MLKSLLKNLLQLHLLETLIALVKKGLLTISQAAAQANMTVPEFEALTGLKAEKIVHRIRAILIL